MLTFVRKLCVHYKKSEVIHSRQTNKTKQKQKEIAACNADGDTQYAHVHNNQCDSR